MDTRERLQVAIAAVLLVVGLGTAVVGLTGDGWVLEVVGAVVLVGGLGLMRSALRGRGRRRTP